MGRFLEPDPIGFLAGMNLYAYVGNNPVNFVDPWGLSRLTWAYGGHIPVSPAPVAFGAVRRRTSRTIKRFVDLFKVWFENPAKTRTIPERTLGSYADVGFTLGVTDFSGRGDQIEKTIDLTVAKWGFVIGLTDDGTFNSFELSVGIGLKLIGITQEIKTNCTKR